jgi:hypothetical protein
MKSRGSSAYLWILRGGTATTICGDIFHGVEKSTTTPTLPKPNFI